MSQEREVEDLVRELEEVAHCIEGDVSEPMREKRRKIRRVETNFDDFSNTFRESESKEFEEVFLKERTFGVGSDEPSEDGGGVESLEKEFGPDVDGEGERDKSNRSSELRKMFGCEESLRRQRTGSDH